MSRWSPWQARQSSLAGGLGDWAAAAGLAMSHAAATRVTNANRMMGSRRARALLLQTAQVRDERVDVILRQRVLLHLRLARRFGLGRHAFGVDDPLADLVGLQLAAHVVERPLRVALARNRMTERALLVGVDLL